MRNKIILLSVFYLILGGLNSCSKPSDDEDILGQELIWYSIEGVVFYDLKHKVYVPDLGLLFIK